MPGLWSSLGVVLEGDYSDWTEYDKFLDVNTCSDSYLSPNAIVNTDETEALLLDWSALISQKYTIATKVLSDLRDDLYVQIVAGTLLSPSGLGWVVLVGR